MVLFGKVIPANPQLNHGLVMPWLIFYCAATVISLLVLALKATVFINQLRERRAGLNLLDSEQSEQTKKLAKHHKRLIKTQRSLYMIYGSIAVGVAENVPIGILQGERIGHDMDSTCVSHFRAPTLGVCVCVCMASCMGLFICMTMMRQTVCSDILVAREQCKEKQAVSDWHALTHHDMVSRAQCINWHCSTVVLEY